MTARGLARDRLAQNDDALDRRQPVPCAVVRKIGVGLGREIGPIEREQRRLDVEAAVLGVQTQDAGRRSPPERVLAEGVFDRGDAFIGGKQPLDVAARQEQRADGAGCCGCKAGDGNDFVAHSGLLPHGGLGAALGTETVCLGPGACVRPG